MARKFYIEDNEAIPSIVFDLNAPLGFTEIIDANKLKELYKNKYNERTKDGQEYYNSFRTDLYLDIVNGSITETDAFLLEQHIKQLSDNLMTGNWLTAQNTNQNLTLSGIYDQAMKDEIQNYIDTYITNNY
ncbi:MAG: hypothetical protein GTO02_16625 [Candidatus Dadabacteria bacterium]|nr:hypothetical protein [Candidatus Aenigmarchaeota archaeon]NIQ15952.1 hypothetical protein [Candidatus Dadabacteria bacterium]